jgi:hypothetical protein
MARRTRRTHAPAINAQAPLAPITGENTLAARNHVKDSDPSGEIRVRISNQRIRSSGTECLNVARPGAHGTADWAPRPAAARHANNSD